MGEDKVLAEIRVTDPGDGVAVEAKVRGDKRNIVYESLQTFMDALGKEIEQGKRGVKKELKGGKEQAVLRKLDSVLESLDEVQREQFVVEVLAALKRIKEGR
jgi:BMFP domain-containing protein YqiC